MGLELRDVSKRYAGIEVLHPTSLDVANGEFLTLLGPSGSGKTTVLRLIGGFSQVSGGSILFDGADITALAANRRPFNTVFQDYALFPHMTVIENVGYGPLVQRRTDAAARRLIDETIEIVGLAELRGRYPEQLSGGQKQRVALARTIVCEPKVILLDEPLAALDASLRRQMQVFLKQIQRRIRTTFIFVTHDQDEAITMADRIVVMNAGRIEQIGTPEDVYDRPNSKFVARFIGASNVLDARSVADRQVEVAGRRIAIGQGEVAAPGEAMSFCVKTHDLELTTQAPADAANTLPGVVRGQAYLGSHRDYLVDVGQELLVAMPPEFNAPVGSTVHVRFAADRCRGLIH